jgi:hypothetical protein
MTAEIERHLKVYAQQKLRCAFETGFRCFGDETGAGLATRGCGAKPPLVARNILALAFVGLMKKKQQVPQCAQGFFG